MWGAKGNFAKQAFGSPDPREFLRELAEQVETPILRREEELLDLVLRTSLADAMVSGPEDETAVLVLEDPLRQTFRSGLGEALGLEVENIRSDIGSEMVTVVGSLSLALSRILQGIHVLFSPFEMSLRRIIAVDGSGLSSNEAIEKANRTNEETPWNDLEIVGILDDGGDLLDPRTGEARNMRFRGDGDRARYLRRMILSHLPLPAELEDL